MPGIVVSVDGDAMSDCGSIREIQEAAEQQARKKVAQKIVEVATANGYEIPDLTTYFQEDDRCYEAEITFTYAPIAEIVREAAIRTNEELGAILDLARELQGLPTDPATESEVR